ncbi:MAG: hypothetical protein CMO81_08885 [Waddliaceae bacterium]|nr:hypothetical protein [Waddliaceae bacterium]
MVQDLNNSLTVLDEVYDSFFYKIINSSGGLETVSIKDLEELVDRTQDLYFSELKENYPDLSSKTIKKYLNTTFPVPVLKKTNVSSNLLYRINIALSLVIAGTSLWLNRDSSYFYASVLFSSALAVYHISNKWKETKLKEEQEYFDFFSKIVRRNYASDGSSLAGLNLRNYCHFVDAMVANKRIEEAEGFSGRFALISLPEAESDYNGGFLGMENEFAEIAREMTSHGIRLHICRSQDLESLTNRVQKLSGKAKYHNDGLVLLYLAGHGDRRSVQMGVDYAITHDILEKPHEKDYIKSLKKALSPNSLIFLESCMTAQGENSIAEALSKRLCSSMKNTKLIAPVDESAFTGIANLYLGTEETRCTIGATSKRMCFYEDENRKIQKVSLLNNQTLVVPSNEVHPYTEQTTSQDYINMLENDVMYISECGTAYLS